MMHRLLLIFALALHPFAALAQTSPQLDVVLPDDKDHIIGQPFVLRLKLLVPTWMPKPPTWPELEVPSLLVRLPERASSPVSETINGETWSGISRAYRLYPLTTGTFEIPAQQMQITYADPDTTDPIAVELQVPQIRFVVTLPKGAEELNPPIVANGFTLSQQIGDVSELQVGDALVRTVTADIQGTTPILIPTLIQPLEVGETGAAPLRGYPKEPVVQDSENRGVLSGSRTDSVSYLAQAGGAAVLPPISFQWFNIESGEVETATVDGITLTIAELPPPPPGPADYARWVAIGVGFAFLIWLFVRFLWPHLGHAANWVRARWLASEQYANRRVMHGLRTRDLGAAMAALDNWTSFHPDIPTQELAKMEAALAHIGAAQYGIKPGNETGNKSAVAWHDAGQTFRQLRRQAGRQQKKLGALNSLPELNANPTRQEPF